MARAKRASVKVLEERLRGLAAAADQLNGDARHIAEAEHAQALADLKAAESHSLRPFDQDAAVLEVLRRHGAQLRRDARELAPGVGWQGPESRDWHSPEALASGTARFVRLGTIVPSPSEPVPAIVPLVGTSGWQVLADNPATGHRLLQAMALRLAATAKPFRLRIDSFDPRLTGAMGLLGQITSRYPQIVPRAMHTSDELRRVLTELVGESSSRAGRMAQLGFSTFEDLLEKGSATDPYRVVVLFDYPAGVDSTAQAELLRVAATAADRGICFLVQADQTIAPEYGVQPADLVGLLERVDVSGDRTSVPGRPDVHVRLDPPFSAATSAEVCRLVTELAEGAVLPTIEFTDTLPPEADWWQPARDEVSTVIGYEDRTPAVLRLRTGNPALPHVLIGGAAGQGKSNLLLVLIHGLAVRYAPRDLEMYLLDFKHGVEFAPLGPGRDRPYWLPHVRVLGVHSDRAFGLAVLRYLSEELTRRSTYFKQRGNVADLSELADDPGRPPRALVVLDEFQVLLEEDDEIAEESVRLIERLMRQGRAYGVHLVLATQTIEGMGRLALRRDSIFGQVPYRIALKSTPSDSQAVLRMGNTAGADLQFRGEAILNANFGSPDDNQKVLVSFAERDTFDRLRRDLHARARAAGPVTPPRVFHLEEPARLVDAVRGHTPAQGLVVDAWAGLPIAVAETPAVVEVRQDPGSGVILLGDGPLEAIGVLSGLALSVAIGATGERPRVIVVDGTYADPSTAEAKASLVQTLIGIGCRVELLDQPERIVERLVSLAEEVEEHRVDGPAYLLGIGLHLIPRFSAAGESGWSGADALAQVMRDGPSAGLVSFAWWNRLHVCENQIGGERADISAHIFLRHPQEGVRSVVGRIYAWTSEPQRALLSDGMSPEPLVVVPFAPLERGDVDTLIDAAHR